MRVAAVGIALIRTATVGIVLMRMGIQGCFMKKNRFEIKFKNENDKIEIE